MIERIERIGLEGLGQPAVSERDRTPWLDSMRWAPDLPEETGQQHVAVSFRVDTSQIQEAMRAVAEGFATLGPFRRWPDGD